MPDGIKDTLLLKADGTQVHVSLQLVGVQDDRLAVGSFGRTRIAAAQANVAQVGQGRSVGRVDLSCQ
ncbi:MAG: hypothetical protein Ct9H300mP1_23240 [Planctomycetaceae bacterium]|nr:MAG: hypothetical protein Ct9H300mP1_23240 [Planctomycetaceae bacterium]